MGGTAGSIELSREERRELLRLARGQKTWQALANRARIVPAATDGLENHAVCEEVEASNDTVGKWRRRLATHRPEGLCDEPRPGAPRQIGDDRIAETIRMALEATPSDATHSSLRSMGKPVGHALPTIHRILKAFGLEPHRPETFKRRPIPCSLKRFGTWSATIPARLAGRWFFASMRKSQIQALDRNLPMPPMRPSRVERRTHDYTRHGATSLFAALDAATRAVIGQLCPKHCSTEFPKCLEQVEANVPADLDVHPIMENYAAHKTKSIRDWLARRPRRHVHFTPKRASWINQLERFFAFLTDQQIRRAIHRSTKALEADIRVFIQIHNQNPHPFRGIKSAHDILDAIKRFRRRTIHVAKTSEAGR